jgi:hypothetical protein
MTKIVFRNKETRSEHLKNSNRVQSKITSQRETEPAPKGKKIPKTGNYHGI